MIPVSSLAHEAVRRHLEAKLAAEQEAERLREENRKRQYNQSLTALRQFMNRWDVGIDEGGLSLCDFADVSLPCLKIVYGPKTVWLLATPDSAREHSVTVAEGEFPPDVYPITYEGGYRAVRRPWREIRTMEELGEVLVYDSGVIMRRDNSGKPSFSCEHGEGED